MKNSDLFLELYNDLDDLLRQKYHDSTRTNSVIIRYANELNRSGNPSLIKIGKKLNMLRVLRNSIIHDFDNNVDNIIEISDDAINFLKNLVESIRNPKNARDLYTPIVKLYYIKEDDNQSVLEVMEYMRNKGFSQAPVLGKNNVVKGVFSPNALFAYLTVNKDADVAKLTFKDIKDYLPTYAHFSECYEFISIKMSETDIDNMFSSFYERHKKLALLFVTQSGSPKEPLLGIITLSDVIKD